VSLEAMIWAKRQRLPPGPKIVLLMLADAADPERGECWPSVRWMQEATSLSDRSIQRYFAHLRERGLIEIEDRFGHKGRQTSNLFRLRLHGSPATSGEGDRVSPHETLTGISHRTDEREGAREVRQRVSSQVETKIGTLVGSGDEGFEKLMTAWPSAAIDDRDAAWCTWLKLGAPDRAAAVAGVAAFVSEMKRHGRTMTCAAATYLRQRKWRQLRISSHVGTKCELMTLQPFSRQWCAMLHRLAGSEATLRRARLMLTIGSSCTVTASDAPDEAACDALLRVPLGGEDFAAWRAWFEARGVRLNASMVPPEFWAPSLRPTADVELSS
jgi:hypothetical protein